MSFHLKQLALQQYASTLRKVQEYRYLSISATLGIPPNDQPFIFLAKGRVRYHGPGWQSNVMQQAEADVMENLVAPGVEVYKCQFVLSFENVHGCQSSHRLLATSSSVFIVRLKNHTGEESKGVCERIQAGYRE